ncbi:TatD family hydrolase [Demequina sp. SYSU T00039]|uniref:TatD family hydrolase n=1 Tax=Demequina lignilytica TaxID=3051663 RepID=A0AAW7M9L2_9MICO|nr:MULTISPECIES: TatD family hydrolase [unclassified Demequina]MDN4477572.1 TatD family hydrolase [Demequina sp. SYSU T00039-1]MDN4488077.1 TatD family hydrolase [Demequina sp. SYSU T00039]
MRDGAWPPAPAPLPAPVVDNHTHLDHHAGDDRRSVEQRLADAAAVGVDRVVQIGCELETARWTVDALDRYPAMVGGIALHPNEAPLHADGTHESGVGYEDALAEIASLARHPRIRVIGETGLDFFRTSEDGRDAQIRSFRDHIALAKELSLPLQIHDRDAHAEVLEVLERDGAPERTVFHCFSGDAGMARLCVDRGYFLSFAGTVTFKNAAGLRAALAVTPLGRVLVETDAPYLTPHPHRGAPNAPYLVPLTLRTVAEVLQADPEAVCTTISETSENLYGPW